MAVGRKPLVVIIVALATVAAGTVVLAARSPSSYAILSVIDTSIAHRDGDASAFSLGRPGQTLAIGDELRTNETGFGQVDYFEGSFTRIDRSTTLSVVRLSVPDRSVRVRLDVGSTWNRVTRKTGDDSFEVETPTAVATVRGTAFAVVCDVLRACSFVVVEGLVRVVAGGRAYDVPAGHRLDLRPDGKPAHPPWAVRPLEPGEAERDPWIAKNLARDGGRPDPGRPPAPPPPPGTVSERLVAAIPPPGADGGQASGAASRAGPTPVGVNVAGVKVTAPPALPTVTTRPETPPPTAAPPVTKTPPPTPAPTPPPAPAPSATLALLQYDGADRVGAGDAAIAPDRVLDYTFRAEVSGSVKALILTPCDIKANHGGHQWDTITGSTPIPSGFAFSIGSQTWVLGVFSAAGGLLNGRDGSMPPTDFGQSSTVFLHATSNGVLQPGGFACLTVVRPDGSLETTKAALPANQ